MKSENAKHSESDQAEHAFRAKLDTVPAQLPGASKNATRNEAKCVPGQRYAERGQQIAVAAKQFQHHRIYGERDEHERERGRQTQNRRSASQCGISRTDRPLTTATPRNLLLDRQEQACRQTGHQDIERR